MASIIAEATTDANEDQFTGASFGQLQEVDDVYTEDEPDVVCYAHIIDNTNDAGQNNPDLSQNDNNHPPSNLKANPHRDFDLIMNEISQRVNNRGDVHIIHYDRLQPALICHEYNSPCDGSIVDYTDALRLKLKMAGIHSTDDLLAIFEDHTITMASNIFKMQLNDVNQKGLKTSTVRLLKEETIRHLAHVGYNSIQYNQMIDEIGIDDEPDIFPAANLV
jgi:hypothetical protein